MAVEWLVAGLGNPGKEYDGTKHNVGFRVLDELTGRKGLRLKKLKFQALYGEQDGVVYLKPQTYMNLSGQSIRQAAQFYKLPPERVLVIFDDVSLPPGRIRVRSSGSDGGHNGIKSILYHLQSDAFPRVKVGVGGKVHAEMDLADHVLSGFSGGDQKLVDEAVLRAADAAEWLMKHDAQSAMSKFNAGPETAPSPPAS